MEFIETGNSSTEREGTGLQKRDNHGDLFCVRSATMNMQGAAPASTTLVHPAQHSEMPIEGLTLQDGSLRPRILVLGEMSCNFQPVGGPLLQDLTNQTHDATNRTSSR